MMFDAAQLLGPLGGQLALAFAAGAAACYGFIRLTIIGPALKAAEELKERVKEEKAECAAEVQWHRERVKELETLLMFETAGNNRQRSQLAVSERNLGEALAAAVALGRVKPGQNHEDEESTDVERE